MHNGWDRGVKLREVLRLIRRVFLPAVTQDPRLAVCASSAGHHPGRLEATDFVKQPSDRCNVMSELQSCLIDPFLFLRQRTAGSQDSCAAHSAGLLFDQVHPLPREGMIPGSDETSLWRVFHTLLIAAALLLLTAHDAQLDQYET